MQTFKFALLLLGLGLPVTVGAQSGRNSRPAHDTATDHHANGRLRLSDAIAEADRQAFANRGARAATDMARASARLPLKGLLPSARVEAGAIRTTDPIGAFGTLLRQRRVTPEAFAPARLNDPDALNNLQAAAVLEVPLVNGDAVLGHRAASRAADAADARAEWTLLSARRAIVRGYYGAVLAAEKQRTLSQALAASDAMTTQVEHLLRQGLITRADLLQWQVRSQDMKAQQLAAEADARTAREQLSLLLGRSDPSRSLSVEDLPATLPADSVVRAMVMRHGEGSRSDNAISSSGDIGNGSNESGAFALARQDGETRDDVRASRLEIDAARLDARRAASTLLPRFNGVARYDWNSPKGFYAGRPNWTIGVMASWSLFGGGSELADVAGARARLSAARTAEAAATATAQLEQQAAMRQVQVSMAQLDLATQSAAQSREAHRLVQRRYLAGLTTIAELLAAEASATTGALQHAAARYAVIEACAQYRLAVGADPGGIASQLDPLPGN